MSKLFERNILLYLIRFVRGRRTEKNVYRQYIIVMTILL